jgi:hypothetical protein
MAKLVFSGSLERERIEALSAYAQGLLVSAAEKADIERVTITSTIRTPRAQAEAMYNNIASGRLIRYASAGQKVTNLCLKMLGRKESREATISAMQELIEKLSAQDQKVSRHCVSEEEYAKRNIVDVSQSILYNEASQFMKELAATEAVVKIIQPIGSKIQHEKISYDSSEPAIHIEIVIPEEYR